MPPFSRRICLKHTDATGVLYFAAQFEICLEVFEEFLKENKLSLRALLEEKHFLLPIVHAESDYILPLKVDDIIDIKIFLNRLGNTSFTTEFLIEKEGKRAGVVKIVHVALDKKRGVSMPLPESLKLALASL